MDTIPGSKARKDTVFMFPHVFSQVRCGANVESPVSLTWVRWLHAILNCFDGGQSYILWPGCGLDPANKSPEVGSNCFRSKLISFHSKSKSTNCQQGLCPVFHTQYTKNHGDVLLHGNFSKPHLCRNFSIGATARK